MQLQIGPFALDGSQDRFDLRDVGVALAQRTDADVGTECQALAVIVDVLEIVEERIALQHGHQVDRPHEGEELVIAFNGQPLMVGQRQAGAVQDPLFAHPILRHGGDEAAVDAGKAVDLRRIGAGIVAVAAVLFELAERAAVQDPIAGGHGFAAAAHAIDADERALDSARIVGLMQSDVEPHWITTPTRQR